MDINAQQAVIKALKVSELNTLIKNLLETQIGTVWVTGEISNLRRYDSGHYYFTLKDAYAQIKAVMFKYVASQLSVIPKDGQAVLVRAKLSAYEPRGEYQLVVQQLSLQGAGALFQRFLELKAKLQQLGWFDPKLKKPLPRMPLAVGVVTSANGAAIRDIIKVLSRRAPWIDIIVYPALVQGSLAAAQLVKAIELANARREVEVLVVGRGGGSLEDLWPFNEESVAAAILASKIPVVSAVGHEIDFSISDFVADVRAPTPSAAAEMISSIDATLLRQRWQHYINAWTQGIKQHLARQQARFQLALTRLEQFKSRWQQLKMQLSHVSERLVSSWHHRCATLTQRLDRLDGQLQALSPTSVLQRGYALVEQQGMPIVSRETFRVQQPATINWLDGSLEVVAKPQGRSTTNKLRQVGSEATL